MTEQKPMTSADDWSDYDYRDNERGCNECGGRGWIVRCIDDLCHGQDECMHGDPPSRCFNCNRDGSKMDSYL